MDRGWHCVGAKCYSTEMRENIDSEIMPPILFENLQWLVGSNGLESKQTEFDAVGGYFIDAESLAGDWIPHIVEKIWCDPRLFVEAYYQAWRLIKGLEFEMDRYAFVPDQLATAMLDQEAAKTGWKIRGARTLDEVISQVGESGGPYGDYAHSFIQLNSAHVFHLPNVFSYPQAGA